MTKFFTLEGHEFELAVQTLVTTIEYEGRIYDRESFFQPTRVCAVFVERGAQRGHLLAWRIRLALEQAHPIEYFEPEGEVISLDQRRA